MSIVPKETIEVVAQSVGISTLPADVSAALASDAEYRLREIMQEAIKCMRHAKRAVLTADDVDSALSLWNVEPVYGFASGDPLRFKRALGHKDLFYIDDREVDFKEIIEGPLPKAPLDTAVLAHWLAIEGIQPAIPENPPHHAYLFDGYWEDIGTIKSFFEANLALTDQSPNFHFYEPVKPIFTSPRFLPPTKVEDCKVLNSIVSHGCFLTECSVEHSVIGIRSRLQPGVQLKDTMMMGADYYQTEAERFSELSDGKVPVGVGENTKIRNCIIDKNARIGKNVVITNSEDNPLRFFSGLA